MRRLGLLAFLLATARTSRARRSPKPKPKPAPPTDFPLNRSSFGAMGCTTAPPSFGAWADAFPPCDATVAARLDDEHGLSAERMPPTHNGPRELGAHELPPYVHASLVLLPELALEPTLTVVTAVHNAAPFIATTLAATLEATSGLFELVLVFDECSDDSLGVVAELLRRHVNSSVVRGLNRWWFDHAHHLHHNASGGHIVAAADVPLGGEGEGQGEGGSGGGASGGGGGSESASAAATTATTGAVPSQWAKACMLFSGMMVQVRLIVAPTALFETMAENRGFQLAHSSVQFAASVQADQAVVQVTTSGLLSTRHHPHAPHAKCHLPNATRHTPHNTQVGWNFAMALPIHDAEYIWAVGGMRCHRAHEERGKALGGYVHNKPRPVSYIDGSHPTHYVRLPGGYCIRGPILYSYPILKKLGFYDETK